MGKTSTPEGHSRFPYTVRCFPSAPVPELRACGDLASAVWSRRQRSQGPKKGVGVGSLYSEVSLAESLLEIQTAGEFLSFLPALEVSLTILSCIRMDLRSCLWGGGWGDSNQNVNTTGIIGLA